MESDLPSFPVGPILEHYGSDPIEDGWTHHPIRCPFHGDRSPSATVTTTEDEQYFKCHVCDMKGNAAQLIMQREGVDFWDAVTRAEGITGVGPSEVQRKPGTRTRVSKGSGDQRGYSYFKRTWLR